MISKISIYATTRVTMVTDNSSLLTYDSSLRKNPTRARGGCGRAWACKLALFIGPCCGWCSLYSRTPSHAQGSERLSSSELRKGLEASASSRSLLAPWLQSIATTRVLSCNTTRGSYICKCHPQKLHDLQVAPFLSTICPPLAFRCSRLASITAMHCLQQPAFPLDG